MGPWSRVRVAKCQMLVTCFFILLLGLSVATMVTFTYFGAHFAVIRRASLEKNPYQAVHQWAFSAGLSLVGLLTLGAVLSAAGTVREAQGLMAGNEEKENGQGRPDHPAASDGEDLEEGFLCFSLAFCTQVQLVFWRLHSPTQGPPEPNGLQPRDPCPTRSCWQHRQRQRPKGPSCWHQKC
ncbi:tetraspanin-32 isoform X20 [Macaca fascicularis]|uniref:tetraspanin-32 isoform X20 n=1 Tax=Macaca fascicularis TaxID=9541 RepID=UPI003D157243